MKIETAKGRKISPATRDTMKRLLLSLPLFAALMTVGLGFAEDKKKSPKKEPDVPFVPTPQEVVDEMLKLADVKKNDVVYDLGCGDGRIVVTAAKKYGARGVGFDIDPERIKESNENVKKNKVEELVQIKREDIFTLDLSK